MLLAGASMKAIGITGITIVSLGALYSSYLGAKAKIKQAEEALKLS
jgi:hypothetical protein